MVAAVRGRRRGLVQVVEAALHLAGRAAVRGLVRRLGLGRDVVGEGRRGGHGGRGGAGAANVWILERLSRGRSETCNMAELYKT